MDTIVVFSVLLVKEKVLINLLFFVMGIVLISQKSRHTYMNKYEKNNLLYGGKLYKVIFVR